VLETQRHLRRSIEVSLARLGETQHLQKFLCESRNARTAETAGELPRIGGWYAIQGLLFLLTDEWNKEARKYANERNRQRGDLPEVYPQQFHVVVGLGMLVPTAPAPLVVRPPGANDTPLEGPLTRFYENRDRLVREWPAWVAGHTDELRNLEPTGEGVDFSAKACDMKSGEPRRRSR
jgi:hypothetical protein